MKQNLHLKPFFLLMGCCLFVLAGCAGPMEQEKQTRQRFLAEQKQRELDEKITAIETQISEEKKDSQLQELAKLYLLKWETDKCLEILNQIKEPSSQSHHLMASAHKINGNPKEADSSWKKAIQLNPNHLKARYSYGVLCYEQNRLREAQIHWERALVIDSSYYKASYNLGVLHHTKGKLKKAKAHYEQTLKQNPKHVKANINLGLAYCKLDNFDLGIVHFQQAIELDPNNYFSLYNLGLSYAMTGLLEDAIEPWEKAEQIQKQDPWLYFNLAVAYDQMGETKKAIKLLEVALVLDPEFERAKTEHRSLIRSQRGSY